jgi:DNA-binding transcriptional ArsR family regulator
MSFSECDLDQRLTRLLARTGRESGRSFAEIARISGLKKDTVRRTLSGERHATLLEANAILEAVDQPGELALLFMLLVDEDFTLDRSGSEISSFLGELFRLTPVELVEMLGQDVDQLRPRRAKGTAKLLARTLSQHVTDLVRRGDAIGERFAPNQSGAAS